PNESPEGTTENSPVGVPQFYRVPKGRQKMCFKEASEIVVVTVTRMNLPIQLISTDFDGTFFAEFENPPVPGDLQRLIGQLQSAGTRWVINTGRDLSSLLEALARAHLSVRPDYLVVVEREIYFHEKSQYVGFEDWNRTCAQAHADLFARVRADLPQLVAWVNERFDASVYEDSYSPFCLIAEDNRDADVIHEHLT